MVLVCWDFGGLPPVVISVCQSFDVLQLACGKTAWFCEVQLQACCPFVRGSMKLVGAAFGSRFLSRLASISCYSGCAATGYVREGPRWQTWDQCIEGFSLWAGDVSVWQSFDGLQLAFGKPAWFCARCANLGSLHWRLELLSWGCQCVAVIRCFAPSFW